MTTTAIILSHYKEREGNIQRIIHDLRNGSKIPEEIIVICDNPDIELSVDVQIIRLNRDVLPIIRFANGSIQETTHCLFIDDDMTVGKYTLSQFYRYARNNPKSILGFEGNINGMSYTDGKSVDHVREKTEVDIIIRMYFTPTDSLMYGLQLRSWHPNLPRKSLDDIFLCLGNKYLGNRKNIVIPSTPSSLPIELPTGNRGQSLDPEHYKNRNLVCKYFKSKYESEA